MKHAVLKVYSKKYMRKGDIIVIGDGSAKYRVKSILQKGNKVTIYPIGY